MLLCLFPSHENSVTQTETKILAESISTRNSYRGEGLVLILMNRQPDDTYAAPVGYADVRRGSVICSSSRLCFHASSLVVKIGKLTHILFS